MVKAQYRYIIRSTGHSSTKYGKCEVCRRPVSEVYHQVEEREYRPDHWTHEKCRNLFGHKTCLISKRR